MSGKEEVWNCIIFSCQVQIGTWQEHLVATSLVAHSVRNLPAVQGTWIQSLGWEDPLEKEMATHSSILAWKISWREEPGGLQSMGRKESGMTERLTHTWPPTRAFAICLCRDWTLCCYGFWPSAASKGNSGWRWSQSLHLFIYGKISKFLHGDVSS